MGRTGDNYLLDTDFDEEDEDKERGEELEYRPEQLSHTFFMRVNKYSTLGCDIITELAKYEHTKDRRHLANIVKLIGE